MASATFYVGVATFGKLIMQIISWLSFGGVDTELYECVFAPIEMFLLDRDFFAPTVIFCSNSDFFAPTEIFHAGVMCSVCYTVCYTVCYMVCYIRQDRTCGV